MIHKRLLLLLSWIPFVASCYGQPTGFVENKRYDKKLSVMLNAENTPFISVQELIENKENFVLLDAREKSEFEVSTIPGAIWVGYDDFNLTRVEEIEKTQAVVVFCSVGYRSEKIGEKLQNAGFNNVFNLYGSIFEWANQNQTIVSPKGDTTQSLHTYNKKWSQWVDNPKIEKVY